MMRILCFLFAVLASFAHAEEFLDPAVAFKPTARALDAQTIEVAFAIAKGYYLYRDKFRFAATPDSVQLGTPITPSGKEKMDDTFGKVEVYYKEAVIRVPVERNSSGVLPLTRSASTRPEPQAMVQPSVPCPVLRYRLDSRAGPMNGTP